MAIYSFSGPVYPPPPVDAFDWINQGSSTIEETGDGHHVMFVDSSGGQAMRIREQTISGSTWSVTAQFEQWMTSSSFHECGLVLRDSISGRVIIFALSYNAGEFIKQNWNSPTSFSSSSNLLDVAQTLPRRFWLRIVNDGANNSFQCSYTGGESWIELLNESETAWLTNPPDRYGYGGDCSNSIDFYFSVLNYTSD